MRYRRLRREEVIAELLCTLARARAGEWCVLKGFESFPDSWDGADVDLIVPENRDEIERVIRGALADRRFKTVQVVDKQYCRSLHAWRQGAAIVVDLIPNLEYRGVCLLEGKAIVSRAMLHKGVLPVASPGDRLLGTWLQSVVNGRTINPKYVSSWRLIAERFESESREIFSTVIGPTGGRIVNAIRARNEATALKYRRRVLAHLIFCDVKRSPMGIAKRVSAFIRAKWRNYATPPGPFVVVAGPDGVGKTAVSKAVRKAFSRLTHGGEVKRYHFRPWVLPSLRALSRGDFRLGACQEEAVVAEPHGSRPYGRMASVLRLMYYALDYIVGYWCRWRPRCAENMPVVVERFWYDFIVDPRRLRSSLSPEAAQIVCRFLPRPDMTVVLDAPADTVLARKRELPAEEIERQRDVWVGLQGRHSEICILDARRSIPELADRIVSNWLSLHAEPVLGTVAERPRQHVL
jgi:thymidylate kinase